MTVLLGISGVAGSGKDTLANFLVEDFNFLKMSLADPLKRICRDVFDFSEQQLWGPSEERSKPDKRYLRATRRGTIVGEEDARVFAALDAASEGRELTEEDVENNLDIYLTPRFALQQLGTQWGRECYQNIWVEHTLRLAREAMHNPTVYGYNKTHGLTTVIRAFGLPITSIGGVAIADCRFRNKLEGVKKAGGKIIRIKRPGAGLSGGAAKHASESEQLSILDSNFDYIVENDGTLEDLRCKALDLGESWGVADDCEVKPTQLEFKWNE